MHLYKIIGQDIDTLKQLVEYLRESDNPSSAEIELALRKTTDIYNELLMLKKGDNSSFVQIANRENEISATQKQEDVKELVEQKVITKVEEPALEAKPVEPPPVFVEEPENEVEAEVVVEKVAQVVEQEPVAKPEPEPVVEAKAIKVEKVDAPVEVVVENKAEEEAIPAVEEKEEAVVQTPEEEPTVEEKNEEPVESAENKAEINKKPIESKNSNVINDINTGEVLADKFKNNSSVNDLLSNFAKDKDLASSLKDRPIKNLQKAVKINDRIWYVKELFNGDSDLYKEVVDEIEAQDTLDSALALIFERFSWDQDKKSTISFLELVFRRFSN